MNGTLEEQIEVALLVNGATLEYTSTCFKQFRLPEGMFSECYVELKIGLETPLAYIEYGVIADGNHHAIHCCPIAKMDHFWNILRVLGVTFEEQTPSLQEVMNS